MKKLFSYPLTWMASLTVALGLGYYGCDGKKNSKDSSGDNPEFKLHPLLANFQYDKDQGMADLEEIASAPHVFGSERQKDVTEYIWQRLLKTGKDQYRETFSAEVPNPKALSDAGPIALTIEKSGVNLYGLAQLSKDPQCLVAIASHYDTKRLEGIDYRGANDSGSSTIALLAAIDFFRQQEKQILACDILAIWFDGEEAYLSDWNDGLSHPAKIQDNTYGSRVSADKLEVCSFMGANAFCMNSEWDATSGKPLIALILLDMIGSPEIIISRDSQSSPALLNLAQKVLDHLGKGSALAKFAQPIADDHIPFLKRGVNAIDIIDFHHLDTWHKEGDDPDKISHESVQLATQLALGMALEIASNPKVFLKSTD